MMERQKVEERNALNDKLKAAANLRDENIKRILNRLREHVSQFKSHTLEEILLSHEKYFLLYKLSVVFCLLMIYHGKVKNERKIFLRFSFSFHLPHLLITF